MIFSPMLISESVIVTPHIHIFKLSTIAFLNLHPLTLTASSGPGSGDITVWRGFRGKGIKDSDMGETVAGSPCSAVLGAVDLASDSGVCIVKSLVKSEGCMDDSGACPDDSSWGMAVLSACVVKTRV
jgi:hypothetical protein